MAKFKITEILEAVHGKLIQSGRKTMVSGVGTNSREIKKGHLFIALVGKVHDAHRFIPDAVKNGASALIVSERVNVPPDVAVIMVKDTTDALGDLARFHRERFRIPVIAVTGSAGKTTTKEMIAAVLSRKYRVLKNYGTENNQFGVPMTLLRMGSVHEIAVIETGTNRPGDIPWLARIVQPDVAAITNIGEGHLELLKSKQGVFKEKSALFKALRPYGTALINEDDPFLRTYKVKPPLKQLSFGFSEKSSLRAAAIRSSGKTLEFSVPRRGDFEIHGTAKAHIYNALIAIACGHLFKVEDKKIREALKRFRVRSGRHAALRCNGVVVIDDTYNANPVSFRSALQDLTNYQIQGRRILVCGDMLELGAHAVSLHQEIGELAAGSRVDKIFCCGPLAAHIGQTAKDKNPAIKVVLARSSEKVAFLVQKDIQAGDVVLIKGSRGMRMEKVVEALKKNKAYKGR